MKYLLVIVNLCAAIWLGLYSPEAQRMDVVRTGSQIRQLEAAGVINTNLLNAYFPHAPYPHGELTLSLAHRSSYYTGFIFPAAILAVLNALLIGAFWKPGPKKEQASDRTPEAPSGSAPGASPSAPQG